MRSKSGAEITDGLTDQLSRAMEAGVDPARLRPRRPYQVQASDLWKGIGKRVHDRRRAQGLTQQELANLVGLSRVSICNLELGRQHLILARLVEVAAALQVNVCHFITSETASGVSATTETIRLRAQVLDYQRQLARVQALVGRLYEVAGVSE